MVGDQLPVKPRLVMVAVEVQSGGLVDVRARLARIREGRRKVVRRVSGLSIARVDSGVTAVCDSDKSLWIRPRYLLLCAYVYRSIRSHRPVVERLDDGK